MFQHLMHKVSSRVIAVEVKICAAAAEEALRKKERQHGTQFPTKIGGKTSLVPSHFCFVKFSFLVTRLMPYCVETGRSHPLIMRLY
jgi:hypothetical protein